MSNFKLGSVVYAAYRLACGKDLPKWSELSGDDQAVWVQYAWFVSRNPQFKTPEDQHEEWMKDFTFVKKVAVRDKATGEYERRPCHPKPWTYGEAFSHEKREHPHIMPFDKLDDGTKLMRQVVCRVCHPEE